MTEPAPGRIAYHVLGGFRVRRGDRWLTPSDWRRPMAARLVRFLLARRGRAVPEDELLEAFWPDRDVPAGRRSLAVAASQARAALGGEGDGEGAIRVAEHLYRLVLRPADTVDADAFERAAEEALRVGPVAPRGLRLEHAAALWGGEPLPEDRYADWAAGWRDHLADRHREVLAALSDAHSEGGDHDAALRAARRMLESDPLDECAHRRVMRAYAALGRRTRALEQFLQCRRALVEAVGIEPSAETAALHACILGGRELEVAA